MGTTTNRDTARVFGIRVEKFYLLRSVVFAQIQARRHGVRRAAAGRLRKIAGMIDESLDSEQMKLPPKPEFAPNPHGSVFW